MSNSSYAYTGLDTYHALELYHHGIKGMKWGIRRFQNEDGTLTELGKKRYGTVENMQKTRKANKDKVKKITKTAGTAALGVAATAAVVYGGYAAYRAVKAAAVAVAAKSAKEAVTSAIGSKYKDILNGKLPKAISEIAVNDIGAELLSAGSKYKGLLKSVLVKTPSSTGGAITVGKGVGQFTARVLPKVSQQIIPIMPNNGNVQGGIASLIPRSGAAASGISGLLKRKV